MASSAAVRTTGFITLATFLVVSGAIGRALADDDSGLYSSVPVAALKKSPKEERPIERVPFPQIVDWKSLKITLERGPCFGTCPVYSVEIHGDGTVLYKGEGFVAITGKHSAHISEQAVLGIFELFRKADFFWANDSYVADMTDSPNYDLSLTFDDYSKVVRDYVGQSVGMPDVIHALEGEIDSAAATEKWIKGNAETFASLKAENWDFHASDADNVKLVSSASERNDTELVRQLLAAGVPANNFFGCEGLSAAAESTNAELLDLLLKAGAPVHADAPNSRFYETCDALNASVTWGVPRIVRAILDRRPDVNWQDLRGMTALMEAADNDMKRGDRTDQDFAAVARMLIDAGANIDIRDGQHSQYSRSAIMIAHSDAGFVRVLLKAGAKDVNAPDFQGHTPLMNSFNPDVTQALLEGGADPWMVDNEGKTALDIAKKEDWRKTASLLERWMAEHRKPN